MRLNVVVFLVLHGGLALYASCSEDRSKWADPSDMINFDHASKRMLKKKAPSDATGTPGNDRSVDSDADVGSTSSCDVLKECPKCECESQECPPCPPVPECVCEQAALPLLKKYTQNLLSHLKDQMPGDKVEEYNMHIFLARDQIKIFEKFVATGNQRHVHDVHDVLTKMIDRVAVSRLGFIEKLAQQIEHRIGMSLDRLIQFFSVAALASIVLLIEVRLQIAWRRRVSQLIVLMFVISIPWTWYDLYKEAEMKQESKVASTRPEDCSPGVGGYWRAAMSYLTLQEDKCMQYYESLMVDPLVKVPPTKAIAVTFVRFFVSPLKDVGTAISEFLRALLVDLPVTLYPVALGMICLFLFLILLFWNRYSVRLPFYLLTIEPSPPVAISDSTVHQAVADANQQTLIQLEQLQAKVESAQLQLTDKLQHLEQVQNLAIEYSQSQSFGPPSPADSPTIPCRAPAAAAESPTILGGAVSCQDGSRTGSSQAQTPGSQTQESLSQVTSAHTVGSTSSTDSTEIKKNKSEDVEVVKDKMANLEGDDGPGSSGDGGPGSVPSCVSVGGVVDTLLPDGVIEARSST